MSGVDYEPTVPDLSELTGYYFGLGADDTVMVGSYLERRGFAQIDARQREIRAGEFDGEPRLPRLLARHVRASLLVANPKALAQAPPAET